jgi:hypothetical protein
MAHYAYIDGDNVVTQVIVGKDEDEGDTDWEHYYGAVRTSYNTHGGQHATGGTPFRYNYAGIGYTFDPGHGTHGAFIPPQPYPSWTLNADTTLWQPPTPMPAEGMWSWDEDTLTWVSLI